MVFLASGVYNLDSSLMSSIFSTVLAEWQMDSFVSLERSYKLAHFGLRHRPDKALDTVRDIVVASVSRESRALEASRPAPLGRRSRYTTRRPDPSSRCCSRHRLAAGLSSSVLEFGR